MVKKSVFAGTQIAFSMHKWYSTPPKIKLLRMNNDFDPTFLMAKVRFLFSQFASNKIIAMLISGFL